MADLVGYSFETTGLKLDDYPINITVTPTTVVPSETDSSGTATCLMPFQGDYYKKAVIQLNNFKNTGTALSWTFPKAFTQTPLKTESVTGVVTVSATSATFADSMTAAASGWIVIEGY